MTGPEIVPLDPASPEGIKAAHDAGVIAAAVIARLRREGKAIPGEELEPIDNANGCET